MNAHAAPEAHAAPSADPAAPRAAMPPANTPRRVGSIAGLGVLIALVVTVVGVLAVRDALVYGGVLGGTPFLHNLASRLQGLRPEAWLVIAAAALALLGLALLVRALRPAAPKVTPLQAASGVFLRPRDVSRLVESAAEGVDGVLGAHASATPRRVTVSVRSTGDAGVERLVREVVTARLTPLETPPAVRVRTERSKR